MSSKNLTDYTNAHSFHVENITAQYAGKIKQYIKENLNNKRRYKVSCKECDRMDTEGKVYYYRWGASNVGIIACEKHFMEVREALNKAQNE